MALYSANNPTSNMNSSLTTILFAVLAFAGSSTAGVVPAPLVAGPAAPLVAAPAAIGYAKAVPYNVPPYASRVDISTRALAAPYVAGAALVAAAPAAPVVAAAAHAAPVVAAAHPAPVVAAAHPAPLVAAAHPAPLVAAAHPAPLVAHATYAGSLAAPLAHAAVAAYGPAVVG